jgi:hypothetical protein
MIEFASRYRLWIAVAMLFDAGLCLFYEEALARRGVPWRVRLIAFFEGFAAMIIVIIHFWVDPARGPAP